MAVTDLPRRIRADQHSTMLATADARPDPGGLAPSSAGGRLMTTNDPPCRNRADQRGNMPVASGAGR